MYYRFMTLASYEIHLRMLAVIRVVSGRTAPGSPQTIESGGQAPARRP